MIGAAVIVIVMLVVVPVAIFAGGALWSALLGFLLADDAEARAADQPG